MDKKKIRKDNAQHIGVQLGNEFSRNAQHGTEKAIEGMSLFLKVAKSKENVGFEQVKGNLFEYIEAAKFNKNAANIGDKTRAIITDAVGRPHDPADIELIRDGKIVRSVQAKFSKTQNSKGIDTSAASSVNMQRGTKYDGMQRLIRKQDDYAIDPETGKKISLFEKAKDLTDKRAESGSIYSDEYKDVSKNLTDELFDDTVGGSGVKSGGTTLEEIEEAAKNPEKYARQFEMKQYGKEVVNTSANIAAASAITTGIISGVENAFAVIQNKKELDAAIKDVGVTVVKSGAKGGVTGAISSLLHIGGSKANIPVLSDSSSATVIAAGVVDSGVAIYEYARGEINSTQLVEQLQDTAIKATTTIYFTKAATIIFGATNPFIPMAIYSVANYVVASAREIIKNAKLNAAEYDRLAKLNDEATKLVKKFHIQLIEQLDAYDKHQKEQMTKFLCTFDKSIMSGNNCDAAIYAIIDFANETGIALQHTDFNDFSNAMLSSDTFVL